MNCTDVELAQVSVSIIVKTLLTGRLYLIDTDEFDEDFGYGTLPASLSIDSKDSGWSSTVASGQRCIVRFHSGSLMSYVVHDKNLKSELSEYSKRLTLLIDELQADMAERHTDYDQLSLRSKRQWMMPRALVCIRRRVFRPRTSSRASASHSCRNKSGSNGAE